jgi:hypothetical protein
VRQYLIAFSAVALIVGLSAAPAVAGRTWCARDPIVSLNGVPVQIWIAVPQDYVAAVNGPVVVDVQTPARVSRSVVFTDDGFNRHGERVTFSNLSDASVAKSGSFEVRISAYVPVDSDTLRALGIRNRRIPVQIHVVANGELVYVDDGSPIVQGGQSWTVAGTNADMQAIVTVDPAPSVSRTHAP